MDSNDGKKSVMESSRAVRRAQACDRRNAMANEFHGLILDGYDRACRKFKDKGVADDRQINRRISVDILVADAYNIFCLRHTKPQERHLTGQAITMWRQRYDRFFRAIAQDKKYKVLFFNFLSQERKGKADATNTANHTVTKTA